MTSSSTTIPVSTADYRHKKIFEGFKDFIARGNMIDMAVGVVMGNAVTGIVKSFVSNLLNPLIAMIFGKPDMSGLLEIHFNGATISFGAILNEILNFLLVALVVYFCVIVPINKFRDFTDKAKENPTVEKMKFWKHTKKGSTLDKVVKAETQIADKVGLTSSASAASASSSTTASETPASSDPQTQEKMLELLTRISGQLDRLVDSGTAQTTASTSH